MVCIFSRKKKLPAVIVAEATTLRRHMQAFHEGEYKKWAEEHSFQSMLPKDSKARRAQAAANTQGRLDPHLKVMPKQLHTEPYTHARFRDASIEWIVATDQPIQALEHPTFRKMIDIASRATEAIKIPGRKRTRKEIIRMFQQQLLHLRKKLNVRLICICPAFY
ncbi:hypothetical protein B0H21DRAFT_701867 [Amylocystis lapponica]|nr:hypothetical protein B0H21DRAFT_701867 [Amylocystis lapponica]